MFGGGKQKVLVGLDIGSSSIKAVELKNTKQGFELVSFGLEALAQDTVVDGAIMDAPAVAESIKKTFLTAKFKPKGVATGVSGHSVIVKRVVVPAATSEEVEASIQMDAEQYIPFEIAEVNLDYEVVGPGMTSSVMTMPARSMSETTPSCCQVAYASRSTTPISTVSG